MDFIDFLYEQYLKDIEKKETNLTWDEYYEYCMLEQ
jgi:hypothetical protein